MAKRMTRAGGTIALRTQFKDDYGDIAEATSVVIHIFEPDVDPISPVDAYVVSGVPTYLGQGIFEYEFTTPPCGPDGTWHDVWQGDLTCQTLSGVMSFDVTTEGSTSAIESQLKVNDIIQVTVTSGIQATDGSGGLEADFESEFMTTCSPSYSTPRKVRMEVGGFIGSIPDYVIQMAILDASLEADVLTFAPSNYNDPLYRHARYEYTSCVASSMMITNVGALLLRSKTLADLSVEYDTNGLQDAMDKLRDCMDKWLPQIIAGGGARAASAPSYVVKGEWDPDRPIVSRSWESTADGNLSRRLPAANDRVRQSGQRRHSRTWSSPTRKKFW